MKVDIVGGGLSGLTAAISLKERNKEIEVVVHEKHKKIGFNSEARRCGEAHTVEDEWDKWRPDEKSFFNIILKGDTTIGNKHYIFPRKANTAFILNRQEFIYQLGKKAEKLGVIIKADDKIKSVKELNGDYIIDASGCPSTIKRELGFNKGIKGVTYLQVIEDSNYFNADTIKLSYIDIFGYFWIFPRDPDKKEINIGIGLFENINVNLKKLLEEYKKEKNVKGRINHVAGGLIPLGLQRPFKYKNILFVGDSGVGTFIFSGQGIYRALLSGDIAGKCIAEGKASRYPKLIYRAFIKWDVICKIYYEFILVLKRINPSFVSKAINFLIKITEITH